MANFYSGLVVEILENMIQEYDKFYCSKDCNNLGIFVSNKIEPQIDFRVSDDRRLQLSNSAVRAWRKCCKGVVVFEDGEVEQLNRRMQILREDSEVMKQAFFSGVEERKSLIYEVYQLFRIIHHFLCLQSLVTGEKQPHAGALMINPHKNGRMGTGLSQVLIQDSNPTLVTRGLRADMLAFQVTADN